MDSLEKATMLLREIVARRAIDKYALFYYQAKTANKGGNIEKATVYADSSRHYLEQMYCDAIGAKTKYYESNLKKEKEKMKLENNSNRHQAIMLMVVTVLFFIVLFIYYFYYSSKKQNKIKMEMADKLHKEEISHKEIQLSVMRNYLIKKIDVVRKLEKLSAGKSSNHKILLSDEDWEELETFLNGVESMFVKRLRVGFPQLREKDIRLMMLLRINIPQKMLADIYCISEKAVKQKLFLYKSKVGIQGDKMSLREFIESF